MSEGLNKVWLLGNLGQDPELKETQNGPLLKLRIATSEVYFDRDYVRQERVEWHSVNIWGKRGEALAKFLKKGESVFIEGSIHTSSYERDGQKIYRTEIKAKNIILMGSKKHGKPGPVPKHVETSGVEPPPAEDFGSYDFSDDSDVPF